MERRPGFFDYDGAFMRFCQELAALVLTNILFLLSCIPIITIGPALIALTSVSMQHWREGHQKGIVLTYWKAFRRNVKQGLVLSVLLLVVGGALILDILWVLDAGEAVDFIVLGAVVAISVLLGMILVYLLPLLGIGGYSLWAGACEAFRLSFFNWWRALTIVLGIGAVAALCLKIPVVFLTILPFLLLIGFSVPAFGICVFLDQTLPDE